MFKRMGIFLSRFFFAVYGWEELASTNRGLL